MFKDQAAGRKAFFALLVFCQLGFSLLAVFSGVLLCRRADGRAVLEIESPLGCSCGADDHHQAPPPDRAFAGASLLALEACHCRHERLAPDPDSASGLVPKRMGVIPAAPVMEAAELPGLPGPAPGAGTRIILARKFVLRPAEPAPLRC